MKLTKKQRDEIENLVRGTGVKLTGNRIEWRDRYGRMVLPLAGNPVGLVRLVLKTTASKVMDDYDHGRASGMAEAVELLGGERA